MVAFTFRMPAGIPGAYNRIGASNTTEAGLLSGSATPAEFGHAVAYESGTGKFRAVTAGDTTATIAGMLVRPYPSANTASLVGGADPFGAVAPVAGVGVHNIMRRGYMTILLRGATAAAKGGIVYIRIATPGTNKVVGGVEAAADSTNTVAMPSTWYFMGPADALGNCEIAVNV